MAHSRFYGALAALLFAAVCAWTGTALSRGLTQPRSARITKAYVSEQAELYGIILRHEQPLETGIFKSFTAPDGQRLAAGESWGENDSCLKESALFYYGCDGFEHLSPPKGELSTDALEGLLESRAQKPGQAKLIYGFDYYYAAFLSGVDKAEPGSCSVQFEGFEESCPAHIVSVSRKGDKCALLLRLCYSGSGFEKLRFCSAKLIYSQLCGLEAPADALMQDGNGTYFVNIRSGSSSERRSVELIYSDARRCLLTSADSAHPLREGDTVIIPGHEETEKKGR